MTSRQALPPADGWFVEVTHTRGGEVQWKSAQRVTTAIEAKQALDELARRIPEPVAPPSQPVVPTEAVTADDAHMFKINEAVDLLRVSRSTLYLLIRSGDIKTVTIGRRRFITKEEIERFISRLEAS